MSTLTWRVMPLLFAAALLSACTTPCQRLDLQLRQLNADTVRDPVMATDGRYLARFQELAAQSVEKGCLADRD